MDPAEVRIEFTRGPGQPANPVVKPGDRVNKGDLIADFQGAGIGVCYHASIKGIVKEVTDIHILIRR